MFSAVRVESSSGFEVRVLAKQPHVASIAEQCPIYWLGKVVPFVHYHAHLGGWKPVLRNTALEPPVASLNT